MANLEELTLYKNKLMQSFCTSKELASYLMVEGEPVLFGQNLPYNRVFPYAHVPQVKDEARSFICFEFEVPTVKNNIIKTIQINVYAISHQNLMRLPDGGGMRIDAMASEVDKILNGSSDYGLGTVELMSLRSFNPITGYYGRELKYKVLDINRSLCAGG